MSYCPYYYYVIRQRFSQVFLQKKAANSRLKSRVCAAKLSKVYFTKDLSENALIKLYDHLNKKLPGKIAIKLHSGEKGNQNFLRPEYLKPVIDHIGGTVVECNTAYDGERNETKKHLKCLEEHGWTKYFDVDLMDASGPDFTLPIENGKRINVDYLGKTFSEYDSLVVLSHFKGHPMGGFGGALKQLSK